MYVPNADGAVWGYDTRTHAHAPVKHCRAVKYVLHRCNRMANRCRVDTNRMARQLDLGDERLMRVAVPTTPRTK